MIELSRRDLLAIPPVGGLVAAAAAPAQATVPEPFGPFGFPMEAQPPRVAPGGTAKEATVKQFPVSKGLAGVSMRLDPGGLRELHWHANAAEWAYMIEGYARITIIDPAGSSEVVDFGPGDVWYFPRGHGHAIQGLGPGQCHFILVFDNGAFSEYATFSITDWLAHTPPEVLAKNLGLPAAALTGLPKGEVYIARGPVPPARPAFAASGSLRSAPLTHRYPLEAQEPRRFAGGELRIVSAHEFPISLGMAGATMRLAPGALRELHWHPNADEWQYCLAGRAKMTVFGSGGRAADVTLNAGDVGYVPMGYGHYLENAGGEDCRLLLVFNNGEYQDIDLSTWLASNPAEIVAANLGLTGETVAQLLRVTGFIPP